MTQTDQKLQSVIVRLTLQTVDDEEMSLYSCQPCFSPKDYALTTMVTQASL